MLYYPEIEILKFPVEPHPSRLVECQQDKANWGSTMIVTSLWEQQILLKIFFFWSSVGKLYPGNKIIRTYANQNKNRNKNIKRQTENDVRKPIWRLLDHSGYLFFLFFGSECLLDLFFLKCHHYTLTSKHSVSLETLKLNLMGKESQNCKISWGLIHMQLQI